MSAIEQAAWELYCAETAGSMDVRDFWCELAPRVQSHYIEKAKASVLV